MENNTELQKEKRNYSKFNYESNKITELIYAKNLTFKEVAESFDLGTSVIKKYLVDPKLMTGYQRKRLADRLNIDIVALNSLIDG